MEPKMRILIEGLSKVGKSWLASTGPKPLLFLDFEHRARWVPGGDQATFWDGMGEPLSLKPSPTRLYIHEAKDLNNFAQAMAWLRSGRHPWKTIVLDSPMELRSTLLYTKFPNIEAADGKDIGMINRLTEAIIKDLYGLSKTPGNKCDCVILVNGTVMDDYSKKMKVLGLGGVSAMLPHWTDIVSYLENGMGGRRLWLSTDDQDLMIGDGTNQLITQVGSSVLNPNIETLYNLLQVKQISVAADQSVIDPKLVQEMEEAIIANAESIQAAEKPEDEGFDEGKR